jgi:hypothetical protein
VTLHFASQSSIVVMQNCTQELRDCGVNSPEQHLSQEESVKEFPILFRMQVTFYFVFAFRDK